MDYTTSFEYFLNAIDLDNRHQIYWLYEAVSQEKDCDNFLFRKERLGDGHRYLLTYDGNILDMRSDKAKAAFLDAILNHYCEGYDDINTWFGIKQLQEED
jgi:hypothetical protein